MPTHTFTVIVEYDDPGDPLGPLHGAQEEQVVTLPVADVYRRRLFAAVLARQLPVSSPLSRYSPPMTGYVSYGEFKAFMTANDIPESSANYLWRKLCMMPQLAELLEFKCGDCHTDLTPPLTGCDCRDRSTVRGGRAIGKLSFTRFLIGRYKLENLSPDAIQLCVAPARAALLQQFLSQLQELPPE